MSKVDLLLLLAQLVGWVVFVRAGGLRLLVGLWRWGQQRRMRLGFVLARWCWSRAFSSSGVVRSEGWRLLGNVVSPWVPEGNVHSEADYRHWEREMTGFFESVRKE